MAIKAYQHSCGGYYASVEDDDGFHHAPAFCVRGGWGRCYDTPAQALQAWDRGHWRECNDEEVR
jgi:hypothetical protein